MGGSGRPGYQPFWRIFIPLSIRIPLWLVSGVEPGCQPPDRWELMVTFRPLLILPACARVAGRTAMVFAITSAMGISQFDSGRLLLVAMSLASRRANNHPTHTMQRSGTEPLMGRRLTDAGPDQTASLTGKSPLGTALYPCCLR